MLNVTNRIGTLKRKSKPFKVLGPKKVRWKWWIEPTLFTNRSDFKILLPRLFWAAYLDRVVWFTLSYRLHLLGAGPCCPCKVTLPAFHLPLLLIWDQLVPCAEKAGPMLPESPRPCSALSLLPGLPPAPDGWGGWWCWASQEAIQRGQSCAYGLFSGHCWSSGCVF